MTGVERCEMPGCSRRARTRHYPMNLAERVPGASGILSCRSHVAEIGHMACEATGAACGYPVQVRWPEHVWFRIRRAWDRLRYPSEYAGGEE